jgi:FKBP-type peptidyl-prolyl cis-trans isomerase 2
MEVKMKKIIKVVLILFVTVVLVNGCINNTKKNETEINSSGNSNQVKTNVDLIQIKNESNQIVKIGDTVTMDYILYSNGNVYNTNIEKVANDNNISKNNTKPVIFKVGGGKVVKGLEEGVIGMKLGESKKLTIPPEKAFQVDPTLISIIPRIEKIHTTRTLAKNFDIPADMFEFQFGTHKVGEIVQIPDTNINATIKNMNSSNVSLYYNLKVGDIVSAAPFRESVISIDENNITLKSDVKKGETIRWSAWNTTVVDIDSENMTLSHNYIPDTKIRTSEGVLRVHFNDTDITMDLNNELAGKTLIYDVTIKGINGINS